MTYFGGDLPIENPVFQNEINYRIGGETRRNEKMRVCVFFHKIMSVSHDHKSVKHYRIFVVCLDLVKDSLFSVFLKLSRSQSFMMYMYNSLIIWCIYPCELQVEF